MAKILVTGGAGFIGSHVVELYVKAGHDVVVVDNLSTGFRENVHAKARLVEMDLRSAELDGVFEREKPSIVNHLAAQMDVRRSLEDPMFDAETNVLGALRLLDCCTRHGVEKLIYAGTGGAVYGEPEVLPASEETPIHPLCPYGVSKYTVEQYIRMYKRVLGLPYTILRFPNVYGPRQNPKGEAGVCAIFIRMMLEGERPTLYGNGTPLRDFVYVEDIARANVLALDKGEGETINLGSGRGTSVREVFETLKALMSFAQDPVLEPLRTGEVDRIYTTGDKAAEILGWKPALDLREGLRRTVEHVRRQLAIT